MPTPLYEHLAGATRRTADSQDCTTDATLTHDRRRPVGIFASMSKTNPGNYFEDFSLGQVIEHATPRTVTEGDRAVYTSLSDPLHDPSSAAFAAEVGLDPHPVEELIGFHIAFGKTVPDVSLNAVANPGTPSAGSISPSSRATPCAPGRR